MTFSTSEKSATFLCKSHILNVFYSYRSEQAKNEFSVRSFIQDFLGGGEGEGNECCA